MDKNRQIQIFNKRAQKLLQKDFCTRKIFAYKQRQRLLKTVSGKTLEVAVGTGANFRFYSTDIELTAVDFSSVLTGIARKNAAMYNINTSFIESDVEALDFPMNTFDTIVSALSLCSYQDPVKVLNKFNRWCRPDGNILLFEHGLASGKITGFFLNPLLNIFNNLSLKYMGDNINVDIKKITEISEIEITHIETFLLTTHYLIWAKPRKTA